MLLEKRDVRRAIIASLISLMSTVFVVVVLTYVPLWNMAALLLNYISSQGTHCLYLHSLVQRYLRATLVSIRPPQCNLSLILSCSGHTKCHRGTAFRLILPGSPRNQCLAERHAWRIGECSRYQAAKIAAIMLT